MSCVLLILVFSIAKIEKANSPKIMTPSDISYFDKSTLIFKEQYKIQ